MVAAMLIGEMVTHADGRPAATPDGWATQGLAGLLGRLAGRADASGMTVLLTRESATAIGLPVTEDATGVDHPAATEARAAGWSVSAIRQWTTFHAPDRPTIIVGIIPLIPRHKFPFPGGSAEITRAMADWTYRTRTPWIGTPGVAGLAVLSEVFHAQNRRAPNWRPVRHLGERTVTMGPEDAAEDDYHVDTWRAPIDAARTWAHGYDANRAYMAAAGSARLARTELRRTGRKREWSPDVAGWWQVELAPWQIRHLPDPAGYDPTGQGRTVRWVSAPTMHLLHDLTEQGIYGGVRVLDSWTAPATDGLLRPWRDALRAAWDACPHCPQAKEAFGQVCPVCSAVKDAGRQTIGLFNRATNWLYRPDWHYSIIALARCNLFRKALKVGGGIGGDGPWPLWFDVDNIWYASDIADPREAVPDGIVIGPNLGQFHPKKSRRRRGVGAQ